VSCFKPVPANATDPASRHAIKNDSFFITITFDVIRLTIYQGQRFRGFYLILCYKNTVFKPLFYRRIEAYLFAAIPLSFNYLYKFRLSGGIIIRIYFGL
jgi:hypothetical protein